MWYIYKEDEEYKYSETEPIQYLFTVNKISPIPQKRGYETIFSVDEEQLKINWLFKEIESVPVLDDLKQEKLAELNKWVYDIKEIGFIYQDKPFKLDDQATDRINKLATSVNIGVNIFPLQWITRNGEQGLITIENKEQFLEFFSLALIKGSAIETQGAMLKFAIEQATTEEELELVVIPEIEPEVEEGDTNETTEV